MLICSACMLACAGLTPALAAAQQSESPRAMLGGLMGTGIVDSELGLTVGAGIALGTSSYVLRALADVHVLQPEDGDYAWDLDSSGPECRDAETGLAVDSSLCTVDRALTGISAEAGLTVPVFRGGLHFGGGYRFGSGSTPYAHFGYGFNPQGGSTALLIRVIAGRDLLGLQAIATFPTPRR